MAETVITPPDDGPYHVKGEFRIVLPGGKEIPVEGEAWLCRCGGSRNKPFCDGTHGGLGFRASERGRGQGQPLPATPAGPGRSRGQQASGASPRQQGLSGS